MQQQQAQQRNAFPGSLSDLVASFENVKQKGEQVSDLHLVVLLVFIGNGNSPASDDKFGPGA